MSVFKRGSHYWINIRFEGRRIRRPSPDNTLAGARAYEALIRQRMARGESVTRQHAPQPIAPFFSEHVAEWFETYVRNNNKQSEATNRKNTIQSCLIPYFGKKRINEISSHDIEKYKDYLLTKRNLAPKTVNNRLCILSRCLKSAVEWNRLTALPKIQLLKVPPQRFDFLTVDESEALLASTSDDWKDLIFLGLNTGLRIGELIGLKWENVALSQGRLTVMRNIVRDIETSPKSNKPRVIPLVQEAINMLENRKHNGPYVFYGSQGEHLQYCYCWRALHRMCDRAGIRHIGWHVLRHTFASRLAENNAPIMAIKELLGHSDIKTTMRYTHINIETLTQSIQLLEKGTRSQYGHNRRSIEMSIDSLMVIKTK